MQLCKPDPIPPDARSSRRPLANSTPGGFRPGACLRLLCALACAAAWSAYPEPVRADEREVPLAEVFRAVMEKRAFEVPSYWPGGPTNFCAEFLRDFRTQRNIKHLTPIFEAATYEALPLQSLPGGCQPEVLFHTYSCMPNVADSITSVPVGERKSFLETACRRFRGTQNLRVYRADMDGDPSNGDEFVSAFQKIVGPVNKPDRPQGSDMGSYKLISHSGCEVLSETPVHDPYDYFTRAEAKNYNGLIEYKKQFYVFDLYEIAPKPGRVGAGPYSLTLVHYGPAKGESGRRFGTLCAFDEAGTTFVTPSGRQP